MEMHRCFRPQLLIILSSCFCVQPTVRMQLESYLADISIVQSCIHLVQDEEGSRAEAEGHQTHRTSSEGRMFTSDRLFMSVSVKTGNRSEHKYLQDQIFVT